MKKILNSHNLSKREEYNILNVSGKGLSQHVGETFEIKAWALTETEDTASGEIKKGFTFLTPDGEYYGTSSKAFVEGIETFVACLGPEELTTLTVGSRVARNGREYLVFIA